MPGRLQAAQVSFDRPADGPPSAVRQDHVTSFDSDASPVVELFLQQPCSLNISRRPERPESQETVTNLGTSIRHEVGRQTTTALIDQLPPFMPRQSSLTPRISAQDLPPVPCVDLNHQSPIKRPEPLSPMLALHRCRLFDWSPSLVVALTPSPDGAYVAAARESGDIEIWRAAAGALGWQCELVSAWFIVRLLQICKRLPACALLPGLKIANSC
jgi:hypothetical protein